MASSLTAEVSAMSLPFLCIIDSMTSMQTISIFERFFERVTIDYCRACRICLDRDATGTVKLFVTDRTKPFVVDSIRRLLKDPLSSVVVDDIELDRRIDLAFEANRLANRIQEPSANAENPVAAVLLSADDTNDLLQAQSATPVIELVNRILFDAVQQQASDIHFQPVEIAMVVRMRMDGVLREKIGVKRRLLLNDSQRIRLAEKAQIPSDALYPRYSADIHSTSDFDASKDLFLEGFWNAFSVTR